MNITKISTQLANYRKHYKQEKYRTNVNRTALVLHLKPLIRPHVHKAFQNQDQDQAQVKNSFTMDFFPSYYNYLTIDCWYLIKKICPPNKTSWNSKLFYERKGKYFSCDRYITGSTLLKSIVSHIHFNPMHFMSKTTFTMSMDT